MSCTDKSSAPDIEYKQAYLCIWPGLPCVNVSKHGGGGSASSI